MSISGSNPVVISKILIQELLIRKYDWASLIEVDLLENVLRGVHNIKRNSHTAGMQNPAAELPGFTDTSSMPLSFENSSVAPRSFDILMRNQK